VSPTDPTAGGTLADPERTAAAWTITGEINELLETVAGDLDEFINGSEHAIRQARSRVVGLTQRIDALQALGPPSAEALEQMLAAQDARWSAILPR
jgi:hypothetical protein